MYDFEKISAKLKDRIDAKRFRHTQGVHYTAMCLAMRYGCDIEKAGIAGLLHDCAKRLPDEEMIAVSLKGSLPVTDEEKAQPFILHQKAGAVLAVSEYGITDPEVLSAISCHTTGKPGMSLLDKIIFVADYIEPHRKMHDGLPEIRELAFKDLDAAVRVILEHTINYLKQNGKHIVQASYESLAYYTNER